MMPIESQGGVHLINEGADEAWSTSRPRSLSPVLGQNPFLFEFTFGVPHTGCLD